MIQPLASLLRPKTLDDVFGQQHLLEKGKVFRKMVDNKKLPNMIFYGPSGVGKTTVAGIIAQNCGMQLFKLNGTSAGTADIKEVIASSSTLAGVSGTLLYLDEIQYLNKKQQQSLLECLEEGTITLIASTTENPYFYVYNALLSRSTVFEFKPLEFKDIEKAIVRAIEILETKENKKYLVDKLAIEYISKSCGGDVRKALNIVDILAATATEEQNQKIISLDSAKQVTAKSGTRYDRQDDVHHDLLSGLQKSIRGSDPNAALHYLARLIESGDIISPCRRLLVMASEDIGLAYPQAVAITKACVDSAMQLGLPEGRIPLAQAAILLATSPKSNSAYLGLEAALDDVRNGNYSDVPNHLKGTGYSGAYKLDRGTEYRYPHDFKNHYVEQQYLPDVLKDRVYYNYAQNKTEQLAKAYWDEIKKS